VNGRVDRAPDPPLGSARWRTPGRMVWAMRGRCPACGAPGAFAGAYRLRRACERCGVVFERDPGSFLGATVLAYAVAVAAMAVVAIATVPGRGLYPGLEGWLIASATATVLLLYRPVKGWWLWAIWAAGWVHRDGEDPERPRAT
jgi:uncharacterized protein (DUF983 family)